MEPGGSDGRGESRPARPYQPPYDHPSGLQPALCQFVSGIGMATVNNDRPTGAPLSALVELNEILGLLGEPATTLEELERVGIDVDCDE
jgi:hypothetical protein